jgi:hypothetical protein
VPAQPQVQHHDEGQPGHHREEQHQRHHHGPNPRLANTLASIRTPRRL